MADYKKRTFCQDGYFVEDGKDVHWINGKRYRGKTTMSFIASPITKKALAAFNKKVTGGNKMTATRKTKKGHTEHVYTCTVTKQTSGSKARKFIVNGYWNPNTRRLRMPGINMVAKPDSPNGGYWGSPRKPKNN